MYNYTVNSLSTMEKGVLTLKKMIVLICVLCLALSMAGCGKLQVSREIAKVNGRMITKAEYMYYLENVKQQMLSQSGTQDTASFWDAEIDGVKASEAAKQKALEEMLRVEIACIKAEEHGLSVSNEELKEIKSFVKSGDKETAAQIDAIQEVTGLTDDLLIDMLTKTNLANIFASDIQAHNHEALEPTQEEILAVYNQEYVRVKHVLIGNTQEDADTAELSEEDARAAAESYRLSQLEKAQEVLEKAKAGSNFDTLVATYGEDPGMEESKDGYTFTNGSMVPEFEEASFALAVGEVSELVESTYGWHIIKRYALPTSGTDYDTAIQAVTAQLSQEKYNTLVDGYKSEMNIELRQGVIDGVKVK